MSGSSFTDQAKEAVTAIEDTMTETPKEPKNIIEIDPKLQDQAADWWGNLDWFLEPSVIGQGVAIVVILTLALFIGRYLRAKVDRKLDDLDFKIARKLSITVIRRMPRLIVPAVSGVGFYLASSFAGLNGLPNNLLEIGAGLSLTVLIIVFAVSFIQSRALGRWIAKLVVLIAALHLFGWWDETLESLSSVRFGFGQNQITLLGILKGLMYFGIFMWIARILSSIFEKQIKAADELTPSLKVLFSKLLKIFLVIVAFLFGLNAIGFDLTTFALFGGAIGVGLGFGLQKVVSNFISGIILLLDRSIKPGDVIAIDGPNGEQTFGWVNTLGARYVSLIRRDGKEHLIPNEILITERVENWSFSNNDIRLHVPVGVAYTADVHRARELCLEAMAEEPRIKDFPKPLCHLTEFGDSSVNMEIRGWINDPVNGIGNVKSDILLRVWDKFREHGIQIPYPQRDLHIRSIEDDVLQKLKNDILEDLMPSKTRKTVSKAKSDKAD